jgi:hypothetical protein
MKEFDIPMVNFFCVGAVVAAGACVLAGAAVAAGACVGVAEVPQAASREVMVIRTITNKTVFVLLVDIVSSPIVLQFILVCQLFCKLSFYMKYHLLV